MERDIVERVPSIPSRTASTSEPRGARDEARQHARRFPASDRAVAVAVAVLAGLHLSLPYGLTSGALAAIIALPLCWSAARATSGLRFLSVLVVLAVVSGAMLTWAQSDPGLTSDNDVLTRSILLIGVPLTAGALMWSAATVSVGTMGVWFGVGMILGIPLEMGSVISWRFTFSIPVTVLLLALVSASGRLWLQLGVVVALAGVGLFSDSRSNSSMLLIAVILVVGQFVARGRTPRARIVGAIVVVSAAVFAVYNLVISAIVEGVFGEVTRQRTLDQIERGGSLILGGRPEIAASTALIARHPWGMGSGVTPSFDDVTAAKQAMRSIGYDPDNGYVNRYLFGGSVEVHSTLGDLWLWLGLAGTAVVLAALVLVVRGLLVRFAEASLSALFTFLAIRLIWDALFSPAASAFQLLPLTLALGLLAVLRPPRPADKGPGSPFTQRGLPT